MNKEILIVEIPHTLPPIIYWHKVDDLINDALNDEYLDTLLELEYGNRDLEILGEKFSSLSVEEKLEYALRVRFNDLHSGHYFENLDNAIEWAENYKGHQCFKVYAKLHNLVRLK